MFFDPDHYYKHFADYTDLAELSWPQLTAALSARWAEERPDAEIAEFAELVRGFDLGVDADAVARQWFRVFHLEQLAFALGLRNAVAHGALTVEGDGPVRELLARDGSVVFVTPHHGPHFLVHALLPMLELGAFGGGKVSEEIVSGIKGVCDLHDIGYDDLDGVDFTGDFKQVLMQLMFSGKSITLYPEYSRSPRRGSHTASFFGRTVHAPTGVARLAAGFQRELVMVRLERRGDFRYALVLGPTWTVSNDEAAIRSTIDALFAITDALVQSDPGTWQGWRFLDVMQNNGVQALLRKMAEKVA